MLKSLNAHYYGKHYFIAYNSGGEEDRICDHEGMLCCGKVWAANSTNFEESCGCLPECNKIDYNFEVIEEKRKWSMDQYSFVNISASIHFADDEFIAYRRFESYGAVSLLSKIGGMLGLFLGISVLSVVEVFYFLTLRLFNDMWSKFVKSRS